MKGASYAEPMAPSRTLEQRFEALQKANAVRSHRKRLKQDVKHKRRSAREVLLRPDEKEESMKAFDLLLATPGIGRVKANKMLNTVKASHAKTLAGLTQRQRTELLALMPREQRRG